MACCLDGKGWLRRTVARLPASLRPKLRANGAGRSRGLLAGLKTQLQADKICSLHASLILCSCDSAPMPARKQRAELACSGYAGHADHLPARKEKLGGSALFLAICCQVHCTSASLPSGCSSTGSRLRCDMVRPKSEKETSDSAD